MINDKRRLVVNRVDVVSGSLVLHPAGSLWQDLDGGIAGCSSWIELLAPNMEGLKAQALAKGVSLLEWVRMRLTAIPYISVDIV